MGYRGEKLTEYQRQLIKALYDGGIAREGISKVINCSLNSVTNVAKEMGCDMRGKDRRKFIQFNDTAELNKYINGIIKEVRAAYNPWKRP
jgi:hypothetical protein